MRERLFCDNWQFKQAETEEFTSVSLPHDWLIFDTDNLYQDGVGRYRRMLSKTELYENFSYKEGERVYLRFDGVYMDSTLFVNGRKAMEWKYGYSAFGMDITDFLTEENNEILLQADYKAPNSRWYSGAGIYRNVFLRVMPGRANLPYDGTYIHTKPEGEDFLLEAETEIGGKNPQGTGVRYSLLHEGETVTCFEAEAVQERKEGGLLAGCSTLIKNPKRWSVENPYLYQLKVELLSETGEVLDEDLVTVGFRTMEFSPDKGFFLNGQHVKVHGVCEHHDFGCLGGVFNEAALRRKFRILKEMGANAVRTSHNMPAKEFMDIADEMGMLVVSEAFDMWEKSKTEYDYARFFKDWAKRDVRSWIRRDRNHPSLMLWSIGNEIYDTHEDSYGQEITKRLIAYVREHDEKENALITIGSNYMPWENARKCADIVKIAGYNYGEKCYAEHHEKYPDWVIYGSETCSVVHSRGVYHFPYAQSTLAEEDEQCSALGNSTTSWGAKSVEKCIADDRDAEFTFGQFIWTGFDYIGEPTPYHTKNSYFGQVDTAGFPKDSYYIFKAEWTDVKKAPMVHVFPYWDFNEGQPVDVRAYSNGAAIELFVNEVSYGKQELNHTKGKDFTAHWEVPYAAGEIRAVAYDENGKVIAVEKRHSFKDGAELTVKADKTTLLADGRDLCFLEIGVKDADGYPVENAMNYVRVETEGEVVPAGMDNGDSTDYDSYKGSVRKLFNGKLLAVLQAGMQPGEAKVRITGEGLKPAEISLFIEEVPAERIAGVQAPIPNEPDAEREKKLFSQKPVRKIALHSESGFVLTPDLQSTVVSAAVHPKDATYKRLIFKAVNAAGIEIDYAKVTPIPDKDEVLVTATGDGEFYIRCLAENEDGKIKLLSQLLFQAEGLGHAYLNPYEFVTGGLYTETFGEIGNGNEKGFATARGAESGVLFADIDFGKSGSDEICLPIFALSDAEYAFQIWEGRPGEKEDGLLLDAVYQKPSIWNVYQEETYRLNRKVKGITSLSFVFHDKVHMKGFSFTKSESFEKKYAADCSRIYGDSFSKEEQAVTGIGNNVTLEFDGLDFGKKGTAELVLCGRSVLPKNTVHVHFVFPDGSEKVELAEFLSSPDYAEQRFRFPAVYGACRVSFVFLPGSSFDFAYFCFCAD